MRKNKEISGYHFISCCFTCKHYDIKLKPNDFECVIQSICKKYKTDIEPFGLCYSYKINGRGEEAIQEEIKNDKQG